MNKLDQIQATAKADIKAAAVEAIKFNQSQLEKIKDPILSGYLKNTIEQSFIAGANWGISYGPKLADMLSRAKD